MILQRWWTTSYLCVSQGGGQQTEKCTRKVEHPLRRVRLEIDHRAEKTNPSNRGGEVLFIWLSRPLETHPMQRWSREGRKPLCNSTISLLILSHTWRYLSCSADGVSAITSEASRRARLAFCSPSAAITCKRHGEEISITGSASRNLGKRISEPRTLRRKLNVEREIGGRNGREMPLSRSPYRKSSPNWMDG